MSTKYIERDKVIIIFLGPPGAGKGTQAQLLGQKLNLSVISMGHLLREAYKKGTSEGKLWWEKYGSQGLNAPIDLKFNILMARLNEAKNGFILDNFPRTEADLTALKGYLAEKKEKIDRVFHLTLSDKSAIRRILARKEKANRVVRDDDNIEIIKVRIDEGYCKDLPEILNYFRGLGVLEEVDGEKDEEMVYREILRRLGFDGQP